jgi:cold shock CspA family protein
MDGVVRIKGFAFLTGEDGVERFVHRTALKGGLEFDSLRGGEAVTFEPVNGPKGPRAEDVYEAGPR